jgi:hypothetical protein
VQNRAFLFKYITQLLIARVTLQVGLMYLRSPAIEMHPCYSSRTDHVEQEPRSNSIPVAFSNSLLGLEQELEYLMVLSIQAYGTGRTSLAFYPLPRVGMLTRP